MERSCLWLDPWQSQSGLVCWGLWEGLCQSGAHQGPADSRRTAPRGSVRCHSSLSQLGPLPQMGVSQMCLSTLLYFLKSQIWSCHIPLETSPLISFFLQVKWKLPGPAGSGPFLVLSLIWHKAHPVSHLPAPLTLCCAIPVLCSVFPHFPQPSHSYSDPGEDLLIFKAHLNHRFLQEAFPDIHPQFLSNLGTLLGAPLKLVHAFTSI